MIDFELLGFRMQRALFPIRISETPWFDSAESSEWFLDRLGGAKQYLEFGTGGSTYAAAKLGTSFAAVDSDRRFLEAVERKIARDGYANPETQTYRYADIGPTGPWARPLGSITAERELQFRHYSDPPATYGDSDALPDLILVDGRFRVACALKVLRMLREEHGWTMVVDDYTDRPADHVIADFARLEKVIGRMAVFRAPAAVDLPALDRAIAAYETVLD